MAVPRTRSGSVRFTTYNVLDLGAGDSSADREHYGLVVASIRALDPDVLAIQEIRGADGQSARRLMRRLSDDTGLRRVM